MTDEEYTNMDLDTAEELLIHAGRPELAQALRFQAQGVRNLVQGEWGASFVNSLDGLLEKHVNVILEEIGGLREGQRHLQAGFQTLTETVDELQIAMDESQKDRKMIHQEIAAVKEQLSTYMAGSKRGEIAVLQEQIRELRGPELPPEQRARYISILLKMIAEWERTHPDD